MSVPQSSTRNFLLRSMAGNDYARLEQHFRRIPLPVGHQLHQIGRPIDFIYFPDNGIASIVTITSDGKQCEVGLVGREGMSSTATVLGSDVSPYDVYVQSTGSSGLRLLSNVLEEALEGSSQLRRLLLRYVEALMSQFASSIAAASLTIDQRLARLLLMRDDRTDGSKMLMTHEYIATMLDVRRPGITVSLARLAELYLVSTQRGVVVIKDRWGLEAMCKDSYGHAEAEYERLVGSPIA